MIAPNRPPLTRHTIPAQPSAPPMELTIEARHQNVWLIPGPCEQITLHSSGPCAPHYTEDELLTIAESLAEGVRRVQGRRALQEQVDAARCNAVRVGRLLDVSC